MVLLDLQGKGHVRKEAFLLKAFLGTFVATKVPGPPAAKSGYSSSEAALYSLEIINVVFVFYGH
ncbi:hypothetical protein [Mucilaginibacter sp. NFX135]|uniref:hypothetical protein n=1 Tax=Mucilaginibacter sp. NFX135 TaxID=3402687 RepID=UPI003AFB14AD